MTTLKQRFALLHGMKPEISQADLSRATGAKPPSVSAWFRGDTKSMKADTATKAASLYGVNAHWLATGEGEMMQAVTSIPNMGGADKNKSNVLLVGSNKRVPRLSWHEVQPFVQGMFTPQEDRFQVVSATDVTSRCFIVEVDGDAMASQAPGDNIPRGAMLICNPDREAAHGDVVVAMHPKSGEPVIRKFIREGGCWFLQASNNAYPLIEIDGPSAIVARAQEVLTRRTL